MKIVDNKKDIYDYLVSYYGIDDYVVYDRRKSIPLKNELRYTYLSSHPDTLEITGKNIYVCTLAAGESVGQKFLIRDCNWGKKIDTKISIIDCNNDLLSKWDISFNTMDRLAIATKELIRPQEPLILSIYFVGRRHYYNVEKEMYTYENPILKDTPFSSILTPNEIWEGIYNYLLKCKEPNIVDKRTDIEHLESAGFDKKTSFRNIK